MRVLHMAHMAPPVHNAGAETHTHAMLVALVQAGHEVDVLLSQPADPAEWEIDGVRVHGYRDKRDPFGFLPDTDLVTCHLENTARATYLARSWWLPLVHICHNDLPFTRRWLGHQSVRLAVFNTRWMADGMAGAARSRSVIVHPYPDPALYHTEPGDRVTLVNLWPDKGGEVFAALAARMPRTKFLGVKGAYGQPQIAPERANVDIQAHTPDVRGDILSRTRILLMPSSYESFGRVAAEAMTCGIPVIAHPTPGLVENLGDAGIFVDRDDIAGWQDAITALSKPAAWKRASAAALDRSAQQQAERADELAAWVDACEQVASTRRHLVGVR